MLFLCVYLPVLLAEHALLGDYQFRIEPLKTQYFIASQCAVQ